MVNVGVWRPPIGDASFNGPIAGPHAASTTPRPSLAAEFAGRDVTLRQLVLAVRPGLVTAFPDHPRTAGNAAAACTGSRSRSQAPPLAGQVKKVSAAKSKPVRATAPAHIGKSRRRHVTASGPVPLASSIAHAAPQELFDVMLKRLENWINCSEEAKSFPPYTLMTTGLAGSKKTGSGVVLNSIELIYGRLGKSGAVGLRIAVTDAGGIRSVSPIRVFEKSDDDVGEASLRENLLPAGAREGLLWLTNQLENNRPKALAAGAKWADAWRAGFAGSLMPRMGAGELSAAISALCSVDVSRPGVHNPDDQAFHKGLAKSLLKRMKHYLIGRLGSECWSDLKLIVTGLNGMNGKPPGEEIGTCVILKYALQKSGDVELLIERKNEGNPGLDISFRHVFVFSEYHQAKTFYGDLFLSGVVRAGLGPEKKPLLKSVTHWRNAIAKTLRPKMSGAALGQTMEAYYPLTAAQSAQDILLRNSSE